MDQASYPGRGLTVPLSKNTLARLAGELVAIERDFPNLVTRPNHIQSRYLWLHTTLIESRTKRTSGKEWLLYEKALYSESSLEAGMDETDDNFALDTFDGCSKKSQLEEFSFSIKPQNDKAQEKTRLNNVSGKDSLEDAETTATDCSALESDLFGTRGAKDDSSKKSLSVDIDLSGPEVKVNKAVAEKCVLKFYAPPTTTGSSDMVSKPVEDDVCEPESSPRVQERPASADSHSRSDSPQSVVISSPPAPPVVDLGSPSPSRSPSPGMVSSVLMQQAFRDGMGSHLAVSEARINPVVTEASFQQPGTSWAPEISMASVPSKPDEVALDSGVDMEALIKFCLEQQLSGNSTDASSTLETQLAGIIQLVEKEKEERDMAVLAQMLLDLPEASQAAADNTDSLGQKPRAPSRSPPRRRRRRSSVSRSSSSDCSERSADHDSGLRQKEAPSTSSATTDVPVTVNLSQILAEVSPEDMQKLPKELWVSLLSQGGNVNLGLASEILEFIAPDCALKKFIGVALAAQGGQAHVPGSQERSKGSRSNKQPAKERSPKVKNRKRSRERSSPHGHVASRKRSHKQSLASRSNFSKRDSPSASSDSDLASCSDSQTTLKRYRKALSEKRRAKKASKSHRRSWIKKPAPSHTPPVDPVAPLMPRTPAVSWSSAPTYQQPSSYYNWSVPPPPSYQAQSVGNPYGFPNLSLPPPVPLSSYQPSSLPFTSRPPPASMQPPPPGTSEPTAESQYPGSSAYLPSTSWVPPSASSLVRTTPLVPLSEIKTKKRESVPRETILLTKS